MGSTVKKPNSSYPYCSTNDLDTQSLERKHLSHFLAGLNCVFVIGSSVFLVETSGGLAGLDIHERSLSGKLWMVVLMGLQL
jgi:hypothetical protein